MENGRVKLSFFLKIGICLMLVSLAIVFLQLKFKTKTYAVLANSKSQNVSKISTQNKVHEDGYIYLSEMNYDNSKSKPGYGGLFIYDKTSAGKLITLRVENSLVEFEKGIFAHATSTLVYDLTDYSEYAYFTGYLGLDASQGDRGNGVKFYVYTSTDGVEWTLRTEKEPKAVKGNSDATFVKIDIRGAKYLKLYADDNGSNGNDHSVYADAKLIKENYNDNVTKTVEEYDKLIKEYPVGTELTGEYEKLVLQREFVKNVGQYNLKMFIKADSRNQEVLDWLMNNPEILKLYLVGGKPDGTYASALSVLSELYFKYGDDLKSTEVSEYGVPLKDIYLKMILSLSLTHSTTCGLWTGGVTTNSTDPNNSDEIVRYEIYKKMHKEKLITNVEEFEKLTVEEMRFVMNNIIDDEEILWLNDFARNSNKNNITDPYSYITYTLDYHYELDKYYDQSEYKKWDEKYNLSKFNITYKKGYPKLWIVFEEGSVCGGLSKTGCCLWGSYVGLPSTCISQPGHCAYLIYSTDSNGNGKWSLMNDVYGWGKSGRTEKLSIRMPNGWGSGSYASEFPASYILLAQAAQNQYSDYEKAEKVLMLEGVYKDDFEQLEKIYRNALEEENINFDAWYGLVELYKNKGNVTDAQWYALAEEITTVYKYYPLPMYDLLRLIESNLSVEYKIKLGLLRNRVLTEAKNTTDSQSIQADAVRKVADYLLGTLPDKELATFSFDGEKAKQLVLTSKYDDVQVRWEYSLDGGNSWTGTSEHTVELTEEQIKSITSENDIKVHVVGIDRSEENIFTIDIKESAGLPKNLYANDLENKITGKSNVLEWKYNESDKWIPYSKQEPDLNGDKTVIVRTGATEVYLAGDETKTFSFTAESDVQEKTRKYVPISRLSIHEVSSQEPGHEGSAEMVIDGNINTRWHTNWNAQDTNRFITIKFDSNIFLSALEYYPTYSTRAENGTIKEAVVYVSLDGEDWEQVATASWSQTPDKKVIDLPESVEARYVKISTPESWMSAVYNNRTGNFTTASMINFYEDTTKETTPFAGITYDITEPTNKNVTATLTDFSEEIEITSEGGNTHTFTENGSFTFEFKDKSGNKGTAVAEVNWIDKKAPTAKVVYNIKSETDQDVIATLTDFSEEVEITNNSGKETYTFSKNGTFTFEFKDKAGNKGTAVADVTWILDNSDELVTPDEKITSEEYHVGTKYISKINPGTTLEQFKENIKSSNGVVVVNGKAKSELTEDTVLSTGMTININSKFDYTIVVTGDVDGNGKTDINDVAKMKLHLIQLDNLENEHLEAANTDFDDRITLNDLAKLKLKIIGLE